MTQPIGAIVLAAGFSSRFGSSKLLAPLRDGIPVFEQTLRRIAAAIPVRLIITRPEMLDSLQPLAPGTSILPFEQAEQGMGATLAFAARQVDHWGGCLICLGDMPFIKSSTYSLIASQLDESSIILPTSSGAVGNPVAFGRNYFTELTELDGDAGGRKLIELHAEAVKRLSVDDPGILQDIDTPAELARLQDRSDN